MVSTSSCGCTFSFPGLMLLLLLLLAIFTKGFTQQQQQTIQQLDLAIQAAAFQRLAPLPKTGVIYNVTLDSSLGAAVTSVQAVRLRSGSLRRHGLEFNEFSVPLQCLVETTSKYVVLIYRSFATASYPLPLPEGYMLLSPVLGIKAYQGNDLNAAAAAAEEINIFSGPSAITVRPQVMGRSSSRSSTRRRFCAFFDKEGTFRLSNLSSSSSSSSTSDVCTLSQLVDSSLVVEGAVGSPAPAPAPSPDSDSAAAPAGGGGAAPAAGNSVDSGGKRQRNGKRSSKAWKLGVGISLGGITLAMLLAVVGFAAVRSRNKARIARMEFCADNSESLQTALIGGSRAPAAAGSRTRPVLENDYLSP